MEIQEDQLRELVKAGVHIGHRKARRHPRMMKFIFGMRGNTEIIDVSKTLEALAEAQAFLEEAAEKRKTIMFVGTRPALSDITKAAAVELGLPYVTVRWIGGTITNFAVIGKRLDAFRRLVDQEASGELKEKYTKAERVRFQRKIAKLQEELGGIKEMVSIPDVLVITSLRTNKIAALEARKKGIITIAVVDTDCDPTLVDYPIPANDDALPSVSLLINRLKDAIVRGRAKSPAPKPEEGKEEKTEKDAESVLSDKKEVDKKEAASESKS